MSAPPHPPTVPVALPSAEQGARRARRFGLAAAVSGLAYVAFSGAVRLGLLEGVDQRLADLGRPGEEWQPRQQLLSHVTTDFRPFMVGSALITLMLLVLIVRRQVRLVAVVGVVAAAAVLLAAGTKFLVGRPDVQGQIYNHGSYPSGHAVCAVVCAGLALLLMWPSPRWWHLALPVVPGLGMGVCLVVVGMHWASDALGGTLLGLTALAAACCWQATRSA